MLGSGPGDDIVGLGDDDRPRRDWPTLGRRTRIALAAVTACALVAVAAVFVVSRQDAQTPAQQALARLITQVTTVPVHEKVEPAQLLVGAGVASGDPDTQSPPSYSGSVAFAGAGIMYGPEPTSGSAAGSGSTVLLYPATGQVLGLSVPIAVHGPPLTAGGHPELLYVATADCPVCAANSWALLVALSRFGTFSGLATSHAPKTAGLGPIDGWTFAGSSYASRYLTFVPVGPRRLTPAERAIVGQRDPRRTAPFLDFGGRAAQLGSSVFARVLVGQTPDQLAADLRRADNPAGATILATANTLTRQLCRLTGDRPAAVCAR